MQLKNFLLHFSFYKAKNATLQKQKFYIKMLLKNFYYIFSFFEILFGSFKYQSIFLIISLWDFILSCSSLNSLNTLILKGLLDCSDYTRSFMWLFKFLCLTKPCIITQFWIGFTYVCVSAQGFKLCTVWGVQIWTPCLFVVEFQILILPLFIWAKQ